MEQIIGGLTLVTSTVGFIVAVTHSNFFGKDHSSIARKFRYLFITDAAIYLVTMLFGVWAFFDLGFTLALILHVVRIPLIIANVTASVLLYQVYYAKK